MEYRIAMANDYEVLVFNVNQLLGKGFRPHGNLVVTTYDDGSSIFLQPVVKEEG